jgi:hypothetical protein
MSLLVLNSKSGAAFFVNGRREWSIIDLSCSSYSCIPNDLEIFLKAMSQLSDLVKLPKMVITPLGPGIFSWRYA